jgi:hypothetical protein
MVKDRQPVQRRTEQQDLSVCLDKLGQGRARSEAVMPRLNAVTTVCAPPTTQPMALMRVWTISTTPGRTPSLRRSLARPDRVTGRAPAITSAAGMPGKVAS